MQPTVKAFSARILLLDTTNDTILGVLIEFPLIYSGFFASTQIEDNLEQVINHQLLVGSVTVYPLYMQKHAQ